MSHVPFILASFVCLLSLSFPLPNGFCLLNSFLEGKYLKFLSGKNKYLWILAPSLGQYLRWLCLLVTGDFIALPKFCRLQWAGKWTREWNQGCFRVIPWKLKLLEWTLQKHLSIVRTRTKTSPSPPLFIAALQCYKKSKRFRQKWGRKSGAAHVFFWCSSLFSSHFPFNENVTHREQTKQSRLRKIQELKRKTFKERKQERKSGGCK